MVFESLAGKMPMHDVLAVAVATNKTLEANGHSAVVPTMKNGNNFTAVNDTTKESIDH
jgi:hypothetical protein